MILKSVLKESELAQLGPDKIENLSVPVSRLFDWKFYKNISGRIYIIKTKIIIINNNNKIIIIIIIIKNNNNNNN